MTERELTEQELTERSKSTAGYIGWATHGLFAVGTGAAIAGVYYFIVGTDYTHGVHAIAGGVCLLAGALAYGQLLNSLVRR